MTLVTIYLTNSSSQKTMATAPKNLVLASTQKQFWILVGTVLKLAVPKLHGNSPVAEHFVDGSGPKASH